MNFVREKIKNIPIGIIVTSDKDTNLYNNICQTQFVHDKLTDNIVDNILLRQELIIENKNRSTMFCHNKWT